MESQAFPLTCVPAVCFCLAKTVGERPPGGNILFERSVKLMDVPLAQAPDLAADFGRNAPDRLLQNIEHLVDLRSGDHQRR